MRATWIHSAVALWVFVCTPLVVAETSLPAGAVAIVNEDRFGSMIAVCAETGEPDVQQGAKKIRGTAVWVGEDANLTRCERGSRWCVQDHESPGTGFRDSGVNCGWDQDSDNTARLVPHVQPSVTRGHDGSANQWL